MADNIRATPRNPVLGLFSDITQGGLDYLRDPRFRQSMMQLPAPVRPFGMGAVALPGLFESTGFPKTLERAAYGEPLTNIGMANVPTLKPETADAMMTFAPMIGPAIRATKGLPVGMGIKDVSESPFVVYRGGIKGKAITTEGLDPGSVQLGQGAYFGSSKGMAEEFAKYRPDGVVEAYHLNLKTPFDETAKIIPSTEQMQALRKNLLDIGVPKIYVDELEQPYRGAITNLSDAFSKKLTRQGKPTTNWQAADKINAAIRKSGFDGIIADVPEGGEQYVAFSKNQFKPLNKLAQESIYPQQAALDLAQQRAALPVSEGGLGLPAGNTAEQRAAAMGFDTDAYHGTKSTNIKKFMPEGGTPEGEKTLEWYKNRQLQNEPVGYMSFRSGSFFSPKPEYAGNYTGEGTGAMYPVKLKMDNPLNLLPNNAGRYGVTNTPDARKTIDAMVLQDSIDKSINEISIINPDQIRSRFAAFDPFRRSAAIAATMGVAAPDLLANELDYPSNPMYTDPLGYSIR